MMDKDYHKRWRLANPEKWKLYQRRYRAKHKKQAALYKKLHPSKHNPEYQKTYKLNYKFTHPVNLHNSRLKDKYGLTVEEYNNLLLKQNGVCAICHNPETKVQRKAKYRLAVDHDHSTGQIRGLLCNNCNRGIGLLKDDTSILENAIVYLRGKEVGLIQREGREKLDIAPEATPKTAGWTDRWDVSMNPCNEPVKEHTGEFAPNGWQNEVIVLQFQNTKK